MAVLCHAAYAADRATRPTPPHAPFADRASTALALHAPTLDVCPPSPRIAPHALLVAGWVGVGRRGVAALRDENAHRRAALATVC